MLKKQMYLIIISIAFFLFSNIKALSANWKDTKEWLSKYYNYPSSGPNTDWPSSNEPKIINDTIRTIDGTIIPLFPDAYELSIQQAQTELRPLHPQTNIRYRIKFSGSIEAKEKYFGIVNFLKNKFNIDIENIPFKNLPGGIEIKGKTKKMKIEILFPGKRHGTNYTFPNIDDYAIIDLTFAWVEHFYFSRNHLRVLNNNVTLSDGTLIPIFPGKKIHNVETGNISGLGYPATILKYTVHIYKEGTHENEFIKLYKFYANHFGFNISNYKVMDHDNTGFILQFEDSKLELQITTIGQPEMNGLKLGNIDNSVYSSRGYSHMHVTIKLKNKKQIIPE